VTGRFTTTSEEETARVGRDIGSRLAGGAVVLVEGDLGAGKTVFVKGLAAGLGIDPDEVTSPTFTLIQEYRGGRLLLIHVDLYRLSAAEVDDLGLDEIAQQGGVIAIEWPDRLPRPFDEAVRVRIAQAGESARTIEVGPDGYSER
jgi:tRNA threonylcarbamoyladenosine biosynthesis protein TsaE